ncbi:MAG: hypothetical protein OEY44_01240 [Candidatus Peregrinibacteria bacterium]|nr:hypothetical protein [Candidatus Peregrinibacteria bacterium]
MVNLLKHKVALLVGLVAAILVGAAAYSGVLNNLLGANLLSQSGTLEVSFDDIDGDGFQETFTLTCNAGSCAQLAYEFGIPGIEEYVPCSGAPCSVTANLPPSIESETYAFLAAFTGAADAEGLILDFTTGTVMDIALVGGSVVGPTPRSTPDPEVSGLLYDSCPTEAGTEAGCNPPVIAITPGDIDGDEFAEEVTFTCSDDCVDYEIDFFDAANNVLQAVYGGDPSCPIIGGSLDCTFTIPTGTTSVYFGAADDDDLESETTLEGPFDACPGEHGAAPDSSDGCDQTPPDLTLTGVDADNDGFFEAVEATCSDIVECNNLDIYYLNTTDTSNLVFANLIGEAGCEASPGDAEFSCANIPPAGTVMVVGQAWDHADNGSSGPQYINLEGEEAYFDALVYANDECPGEDGTGHNADGCAPPVLTIDTTDVDSDGFVDTVVITCDDYEGCSVFYAQTTADSIGSAPVNHEPLLPCPSTGACSITIADLSLEGFALDVYAEDTKGLYSEHDATYEYSDLDWCLNDPGAIVGCDPEEVSPGDSLNLGDDSYGPFIDYLDQDGDGLLDTFQVIQFASAEINTMEITMSYADESSVSYTCLPSDFSDPDNDGFHDCFINLSAFNLTTLDSPDTFIAIESYEDPGGTVPFAESLAPPYYLYAFDHCPEAAGNSVDGCPLPLISASDGADDADDDGFVEAGVTFTCTAQHYDCASITYTLGANVFNEGCIATLGNSCDVLVSGNGGTYYTAKSIDAEGYESPQVIGYIPTGNDDCPGTDHTTRGFTGGCDVTPPVITVTEADADGDGFIGSLVVSCTDDALGQEESGCATLTVELEDPVTFDDIYFETRDCSVNDCTNWEVTLPGGYSEAEAEIEATDYAGNGSDAEALLSLDVCPTSPGPYQGCEFADEANIKLSIHDLADLELCPDGQPSCNNIPVEGAVARVYKLSDLSDSSPSNYINIFNSNTGLVGSCTTDATGSCIVPEEAAANYLMIVRADAPDEATYDYMYYGKTKSPSDFAEDPASTVTLANGTVVTGKLASLEYLFLVQTKQGSGKVVLMNGGKKTLTGSQLDVIYPTEAIWEEAASNFIYPVFFTSDSDWNVNICADVPQGYKVVGSYDENGNYVADASCSQTLVANQLKVIAFEVTDLESPPEFVTTLRLRAQGPTRAYTENISIPTIVWDKLPSNRIPEGKYQMLQELLGN